MGLRTLLSLAASSESFAEELVGRRAGLSKCTGIRLNRSERELLGAIPEQRLREMIDTIRRGQREPERRKFMRQASAALLLIAIGGTATTCDSGEDYNPNLLLHTPSKATMGLRPGARGQIRYTTPKGIRFDWPVSDSRIHVSVGVCKVKGAISAVEVERAVAAKSPEICASYLLTKPHPNPTGGAARITLKVDHDGSVQDVHVKVEEYWPTGSTFGDLASIAGLKSTFETLRFNSSGEEAMVQFRVGVSLDPPPRLEDWAKRFPK